MEKVNVALTIEEANYILAALGRLPYDQVNSLIDNIRTQAVTQLQNKSNSVTTEPETSEEESTES